MTENQRLAAGLHVERINEAWWVLGLDVDMGPYRTKQEAHEAKMGAQRYLRNCHRKNFVTTEKTFSRGA